MFHRTQSAAVIFAACLSAAAQAETVCSKQMLRNAYGFSGTASGFTGLAGGNPISCGVGGVMVFEVFNSADRVIIKNLREVCASTKVANAITITNLATTTAADTYQLDLATCTANIEFNSLSGALASMQVVFTDNGQSLHFTLLRTDNNPAGFGVAGVGTGSRL